jgi:cytosine/adenosine deaminase-related metal-dependent hydrolase
VAEDRCDAEHARSLGHAGALARLHSFGLLDERSILAHGIHLAESEYELAERVGARVAHNPESNCNNRVGYANLAKFRPDRLVLGTDGMNSDMLGSLHSAFLCQSGFGDHGVPTFDLLRDMLFTNPADYLTKVFGRPMGTITEGAEADFAIFPYDSPTPVTADNYFAHLIYALSGNARASWVYSHGAPVLVNGEFAALDERDTYRNAERIAERVWQNFKKL